MVIFSRDEFSWMSDWVSSSSSVWSARSRKSGRAEEEREVGEQQQEPLEQLEQGEEEEEYHQSLCVALNIDQQYRWDTR